MGVYAMADGDGESKGPRSTMYAPACLPARGIIRVGQSAKVPVADAPSPSWPCFSFSFRFFFAATPPHDTARHRVSPTALKRSPPKGPKRHGAARSNKEAIAKLPLTENTSQAIKRSILERVSKGGGMGVKEKSCKQAKV